MLEKIHWNAISLMQRTQIIIRFFFHFDIFCRASFFWARILKTHQKNTQLMWMMLTMMANNEWNDSSKLFVIKVWNQLGSTQNAINLVSHITLFFLSLSFFSWCQEIDAKYCRFTSRVYYDIVYRTFRSQQLQDGRFILRFEEIEWIVKILDRQAIDWVQYTRIYCHALHTEFMSTSPLYPWEISSSSSWIDYYM